MGIIKTGKIQTMGEPLGERYVKSLWFEQINSGTSGTLTPPAQGEIVLDQWSAGVDALASTIASGIPAFVSPVTAGGVVITATLDSLGNWTLSGTPSAYPVAIVYAYQVKFKFFDYTKQLGGYELIPSAGGVFTDVTNFGGKLSSGDTTVQKALDTLDDHAHSGTYLTPTEHTNIGDGSPHHAAITLATAGDTLLGLSGQALDLDTQAANLGLFGPVSGAVAAPTFRSLVDADFPATLNPTITGLTLYDATSLLTLLDISNAAYDDVAKIANDGKIRFGANPLNWGPDCQVAIVQGDATGQTNSGNQCLGLYYQSGTANILVGLDISIFNDKSGATITAGVVGGATSRDNIELICGLFSGGVLDDGALASKTIAATTIYGGSFQGMVYSRYASGGNAVSASTVYGTSSLAQILGFYGNAASCLTAYGVYGKTYSRGYSTGTSTITNAYGVYGLVESRGTGLSTIINAYGVYVSTYRHPSDPGTIINDYGLYIETPDRGTTLNYAIYSAGGLVHIENLTASLPVVTNATKELASLAYTGATSFRKNLGLETDDSPTFAGLTVGALAGVLKATAGVLAGSAVHSDLGSIGANDHHNAITLDANADTLLSLSTQALGLDTQVANYGFFGPLSGAAAVPTFRAMVAADLGTALTPTFAGLTSTGQALFQGTTTASAGAVQITSPDSSLRLKSTAAVAIVDKNTFELRAVSNSDVAYQYLQLRTVNDAFNVFRDIWQLWWSGGMVLGSAVADPGAGNLNLEGVLQIDGVQVVSNRVVDATIDNSIEAAFTALYPLASALLNGIRTAQKTHGLISPS